MIPFSRRELIRAWSSARAASQVTPRTDAHRLLLFYAVECGLKAILLRRQNLDVIGDGVAKHHLHDLNSLMTELRMSKDFFLPRNVTLPPLRGAFASRNADSSSLNQIWRYGCDIGSEQNEMLETTLEKICEWIAKEIR